MPNVLNRTSSCVGRKQIQSIAINLKPSSRLEHLLQNKRSQTTSELLIKNSTASTQPYAAITSTTTQESFTKSPTQLVTFGAGRKKFVIAGCLFTAFSTTRSLLDARQRTTLAPKTKTEEELFETLQRFFAAPIRSTNRSRTDQAADVPDLSTPLLSAYNEIQAFCNRLCLPSSVASYAKSLFDFAYECADHDTHETDALIVSCFYLACRQMKLHKSYAVVQNLTTIPTSEIEATVADLEDYFFRSARGIEARARQGRRHTMGAQDMFPLLTSPTRSRG